LAGGDFMTKEEILEKSRNENKRGDEMEKKILGDAMKYSYLAMILAAAIFAFIRAEKGYPIMDLPAVCCVSMFTNFMFRYVKTKEKFNLIMSLVMLAAAVISAVFFFMGH
jgi:hypothetical protein